MKLIPIIAHLRAQCPSFADRVAGAAEYKVVPGSTSLAVPCAFVVPLDDNPEQNATQNSVSQLLSDAFAVIVALDNRADERGQASSDAHHDIRTELWKALLGWEPAEDYGPMRYEGGSLIELDRGRLWYQFEFSSDFQIGSEDGYQQEALDALPHFEGATIKVDVIDPIAQPAPGPDGRIEFETRINNLPE